MKQWSVGYAMVCGWLCCAAVASGQETFAFDDFLGDETALTAVGGDVPTAPVASPDAAPSGPMAANLATAKLPDAKTVTVPEGMSVFDAVEHVFAQIPLHLNYLELMTTNEVAVLRVTPSSFYTASPMQWQTVIREIVGPHGFDVVEDGDLVRLGSVSAVEARYQMIEQERLRRNRTRIEVNFSEGVELYRALGLIRNQAQINVNFDYMAPADRGIVLDRAPEGKDGQAAQGPPPKMTTYATPEKQPMEWRVVMREVLNPHGYDFIEVSGVVRPMTRAQVQEWHRQQVDAKPLVTRIVRIHHMDPAQLISRLQAMGLIRHSGGSVQLAHGWDSKGKRVGIDRHASPPAIIVRDIEENIETIIREVQSLDTRDRQVMIEARILDIGKGTSRRLGLWFNEFGGGFGFSSGYDESRSAGRERGYTETYTSSYQHRRAVERDRIRAMRGTSVDQIDASTDSVFERTREAARAASWGSFYDVMLNPLQMNAVWDMLQTADDVKVVSQPVLVLSDHAESFIRVETELPYVNLRNEYQQESGATIQSYEWETVNIGVDLRVVPEITEDGKRVRLSVLSRITDGGENLVTAPDGSTRPVLEVRELDTRVTVESGHTLLMGGLISASERDNERKIPFLGNIPVLGWLFRHTQKGGGQRNLVILITPRILDEDRPDTGYERPSEPHFVELRQSMEATLRRGLDEALLQKVEEEALMRLVEADVTVAELPVAELPESQAVAPQPVPIGADMQTRINAIDAAIFEQLNGEL